MLFLTAQVSFGKNDYVLEAASPEEASYWLVRLNPQQQQQQQQQH